MCGVCGVLGKGRVGTGRGKGGRREGEGGKGRVWWRGDSREGREGRDVNERPEHRQTAYCLGMLAASCTGVHASQAQCVK